MRVALCAVVVVVALVAVQGMAWGDGITPYTVRNQSIAYDGDTFDHPDVYLTSSVPSSVTTSASHQGNTAWTYMTVSPWSVGGSGTWETGGGDLDSWSQSVVQVYFTAGGAYDYVISGAYEFDGGTGSAYFEVILYDSNGQYALQNNQESSAVNGESFSVGETGGATHNYLTGSVTGTLIAGHNYMFMFAAFIRDDANTDPLSGSGWATITFSNPVPEPGTLALLGLGLAALAWRRRRA